jgi:excisionase family DNA binding protein
VELTVKEYAEKERVTTRTVYNWIDKGALDVRKTPGGEYRVRVAFFDMKTVEDLRNPSR